jgi:hypothetical protein
MDAVHNVPALLTEPDGYFTPTKLRDFFFANYDAKWGKEGLGLVRLLDEGMQASENQS